MVSIRKAVLLALDLASTVLTLMTGLRENPVLVLLTGRYDLIRSRLREGRITYDHVRDGHFNTSMLPDLVAQATTHRFYSAPDRTRHNIGEDRSTCRNVNSMSAPVLTLNYDDFFGTGARREQIYVYSISAPHCRVVNFKLGWYERCVQDQFLGNATACHAFILDQFDALYDDRGIQAGAPVDFGERGTPFLKCMGRPLQSFLYLTDLVVYQSYWAGGGYHFEAQTSRCWATPLVRDSESQWGLFQTIPADESASVVFAVEPVNDLAFVVSVLYGITSITMILRGIYVALSLSNLVVYVPSSLRRGWGGSLQLPFMRLTAKFAAPSAQTVNMVLCRGENFMASDLWMNHWIYIALSILDALTTVRTTYIVLEMGSWMLTKKQDIDNFIFVCSAITKLTWIMCFVHTLFRAAMQLLVRAAHSIPWLRHARPVAFVAWYVDSVALFMSYKLYAVLLSALLLVIYAVRKTTTVMVPQSHYKQPVYGGFPDLANFWGNEIICDLIVLCSVQLVAAHALVALVLLTRYRRATYNRVLRLLQRRFVFVGWDAMVVMEALGIDPLDEQLVNNDNVATTNCSLGALMQQLYASGPSGFVEFVGDSVFLAKGKAGHLEPDHGIVRYPLETAQDMGLLKSARGNSAAPADLWGADSSASSIWRPSDLVEVREANATGNDFHRGGTHGKPLVARSDTMSAPHITQRHLHIHTEGRWGRILLVDTTDAPGRLGKNEDGTQLEFVVRDALTLARKDDVSPLLSTSPSLRIA